MKKTMIKIDMGEYQVRKKCGKTPLTEQEKVARIYDLAAKMKIKIGGKHGN